MASLSLHFRGALDTPAPRRLSFPAPHRRARRPPRRSPLPRSLEPLTLDLEPLRPRRPPRVRLLGVLPGRPLP
ncbi:hypothetical protein BRADI_2g31985v3 [Brachypodium distachyon]|uniref:Uncharacterized protein n=1 Tax=Brachypodium distachyon TaxID=15368 RepID=A0A0Q3G957_BRADI|nr:hypothetical protein BRADI_2g31985v3 [Brachypodium distachyon]